MLTRQDRSGVVTMGLWGTLSGVAVWVSLHVAGTEWTDGGNFSVLGIEVSVAPLSVIPGLVFGASPDRPALHYVLFALPTSHHARCRRDLVHAASAAGSL